MPLDLNKMDKPKIIVFILALASAIAATVLMNIHITRSIEEGAGSKQVAVLLEKVQELEQANKAMARQQAAYANQVEQELRNLIRSQQAQAVQAPPPEKPAPKPQSLAINTPSGKRALTVNVDTLSAVGGLLNPGDYVDVLVHLSLPVPGQTEAASSEAKTSKTTVTLFQNIQILAIGANVGQPADFEGQQKVSNLVITFAVDPQQAELMTFAGAYGKLQLVLRGTGERSSYQLPSANWGTFTDYLETTQGVTITPPVSVIKKEGDKKVVEPVGSEIKIYRGGQ